MNDIYSKSSHTQHYQGSMHVDDLLYLYEKVRTIAFLRFPAYKKVEPSFEISSVHGDSADLTAQKIENSFSPDDVLLSCSFTLRLPASAQHEQDVSSISFASDNFQSILITAEGINQQQVDALVSTIIYKIDPYVSTMNIGRLPAVMHEERKENTITIGPEKSDTPNVGTNIFEAPVIKSNLSDADKERLEKDSRKNWKYILAGMMIIVLFVAVVMIIISMNG